MNTLLILYLGGLLGILLFIRDYKQNIMITPHLSMWDVCVMQKCYSHLLLQGAIAGCAGTFSALIILLLLNAITK